MRGLIINSPIQVYGSSFHLTTMDLDPQEIRMSLLYWDKLIRPKGPPIIIDSCQNGYALEGMGVLETPSYEMKDFVGSRIRSRAEGFIKLQYHALQEAERNNPGNWALAQGESSLLIDYGIFQKDKGVSVELFRAIPVPNKDVPFNDILEFKLKRKDELTKLQLEIDNIQKNVDNADDKKEELMAIINKIDLACQEAIRVGKEWRFPIRLSNLKTSFDWRPLMTLGGGVAAYMAAENIKLPATEAFLATISGMATASAPAIKISGDIGTDSTRKKSPYRYVYQFHNELF